MTEDEYKAKSIAEFTRAAERFDTTRAGVYRICRFSYAQAAQELAREPFGTLLDCGCGTGLLLERLLRRFPGIECTGLDLTPAMLEAARRKNLPRTRFVLGDAEDMPQGLGLFDAVICVNSLHHYPSPGRFFKSAARVLKPGGRLIIEDFTAEGAALFWVNRVELPLARLFGKGDVRALRRIEICRLCDEAGLRPEKMLRGPLLRLHCLIRKPGGRAA